MNILTQGPRTPEDRPLFKLAQRIKDYGKDAFKAAPFALGVLTTGVVVQSLPFIAVGATATAIFTSSYRRREAKKNQMNP